MLYRNVLVSTGQSIPLLLRMSFVLIGIAITNAYDAFESEIFGLLTISSYFRDILDPFVHLFVIPLVCKFIFVLYDSFELRKLKAA